MITLKKLTVGVIVLVMVQDNELDLNESTVTQLVGTNGTGKSSIPLILRRSIIQ